jgi:hypothetical protein
MKCDSRASLLAHNLTSFYFGREPKARVATYIMCTFSIHGKKYGIKNLVTSVTNVIATYMQITILT